MILSGFLSQIRRGRSLIVAGTPASTLFRSYNGSNSNDSGGFTLSLGFKFTVASGKTLTMTAIGAYAANGAAPPSGITVTAKVATIADPTTILASATFTDSDFGDLDATNRVMTKAVSASLAAGDYVIWTYGYGPPYKAYATDGSSPAGSNPVNDGITNVTRDASNDRYNAGSTAAPGSTNSPQQYGGPTFKGYTT